MSALVPECKRRSHRYQKQGLGDLYFEISMLFLQKQVTEITKARLRGPRFQIYYTLDESEVTEILKGREPV